MEADPEMKSYAAAAAPEPGDIKKEGNVPVLQLRDADTPPLTEDDSKPAKPKPKKKKNKENRKPRAAPAPKPEVNVESNSDLSGDTGTDTNGEIVTQRQINSDIVYEELKSSNGDLLASIKTDESADEGVARAVRRDARTRKVQSELVSGRKAGENWDRRYVEPTSPSKRHLTAASGSDGHRSMSRSSAVSRPSWSSSIPSPS